MSDERLRALERAAAQGDHEARAALCAASARAGLANSRAGFERITATGDIHLGDDCAISVFVDPNGAARRVFLPTAPMWLVVTNVGSQEAAGYRNTNGGIDRYWLPPPTLFLVTGPPSERIIEVPPGRSANLLSERPGVWIGGVD